MGRRMKRARSAAILTTYAAVVAEAKPDTTQTEAPLPQFWSGVIGMEGVTTGDGRLIDDGALEWSTPIPFRSVKEDVGGHQGAVAAGRILAIRRGEGGRIEGAGDFDLGSPEGREAARLAAAGVQAGVSMDLDSVAFEVRVDAEKLAEREAEEAAMMEAIFGDGEDGPPEQPEREVDEDGRTVVYEEGNDDAVMATTSARIRAATIVSIPAFAEATITTGDSLPDWAEAEVGALVASAAPVEPPAAWFAMAEFDEPTALTITDEGQVYGHLASWQTCHIADPNGAGNCVKAPENHSGYAYFHTGAVKTAEGSLVSTGTIRFHTSHAGLRASSDAAAAHYDNTGLAGADIHVTDGKHGIWVAGALRPNVTPEQVRELRAAPLSGDWRWINGALELVGALAVNVPGFPVPRTSGLVASGELTGLVAAGMVPQRAALTVPGISPDDARYLARMIRERRDQERTAMRARVNEANNRRTLASFLAKRSR